MTSHLLVVIFGGLAFRSVAIINKMINEVSFKDQPLALSRAKNIGFFIGLGFWVTIICSILLVMKRSGWIGIFFGPFYVFFSSQLIDYSISYLPHQIKKNIFFNPVIQLYIAPYIFLIITILFLLFFKN